MPLTLGAGHSIVACERGIVVLLEDLQDEGRGGRSDEEATLLVQEASLHGTVLPASHAGWAAFWQCGV